VDVILASGASYVADNADSGASGAVHVATGLFLKLVL
jgi:hypothetical protein